ncbi:MAG: UMP kinase [Candidatus Komeilibacteria bacterium]|nr:UMP kinase [Candidatus Komeilibacteria bacterium]
MVKYKRILVKFSGEAFGQKGGKIDLNSVGQIVLELKKLRQDGVKVAVVSGGGNVSRWKDAGKGNRVAVDYKGMNGTLQNVGALEAALKKAGVPVSVYVSFSINSKYPHYSYAKAKKDYESGKIVIFAGGTGYPFFTTDTAAVSKSLEMGAEIFIKSTKVSGLYTADPIKNPQAKLIKKISYKKLVSDQLKVIDSVAVSLAWENKLPIRIIKWEQGNVVKAVKGENLGSLVS